MGLSLGHRLNILRPNTEYNDLNTVNSLLARFKCATLRPNTEYNDLNTVNSLLARFRCVTH